MKKRWEKPLGWITNIILLSVGVMKDLPNNTQFDFEYLLPWSFMHTTNQDDSSWGNNSTHNYVLLKPNISLASVNAKIENIIIKHGDRDCDNEIISLPCK